MFAVIFGILCALVLHGAFLLFGEQMHALLGKGE